MREILQSYLRAIQARDLEAILQLFRPDARVTHPILGRLTAAEFFPTLLQATRSDQASDEVIYLAEPDRAALYFQDEWEDSAGVHFRNPIVLLFEFAPEGKVAALEVVFDTRGQL